MSKFTIPENLKISTYKLGKSNNIDQQGGAFTACIHCSAIIPDTATIPTRRK